MNTKNTNLKTVSNNDADNASYHAENRIINNEFVLDFIRYSLPGMIRERLEDLPIISLHTEEVMKNNGTVLMGIYLRLQGSNISPCLYVEPYLPPDVNRQPICWDRIADGMAGDFRSAVIVSYEEKQALADNLFNPEDIPERLELTLINREMNKELLKKLPHKDYLDFSIIMRWEMMCGGRRSIVKVSDDVLKIWGIDPSDHSDQDTKNAAEQNNTAEQYTLDSLFQVALINTMRKFPGRVSPLDDVVEDITGNKTNNNADNNNADNNNADNNELSGMGFAGSLCAPMHSPFYFLGTENLCNGAVSVIYPGMLRKMYEALGEAYYLIPSSINEFLALPLSFEPFPERLVEIIASVNEDVLPRMEVLSNSLYIYRPEQDELEIFDQSTVRYNNCNNI